LSLQGRGQWLHNWQRFLPSQRLLLHLLGTLQTVLPKLICALLSARLVLLDMILLVLLAGNRSWRCKGHQPVEHSSGS